MLKSRFKYANPRLMQVKAYKPGKPIEEVERELGVKNAIKLASNENPWGPSPKAVRAMREAALKAHRYPDGASFYLKEALSKRFRIPAEQIVLGNGSDELIVLAIRAFLGAGGKTLTAKPTFLVYKIATSVQGASCIEVPMRSMRYDLAAMAKKIDSKTRIVFIANPDNPIGSYVTHRELGVFLGKVPAGCLVFLDEAYYEYASGRPDFPRSFEFLKKYPNLVISRTFSKVYGLAGCRVGYAFAHRDVIAAMNQVREPFNINSLAQSAALAALSDDGFVRRVVRSAENEKRILARELGKLGIKTLPTATNFMLLRLGAEAPGIYRALMKKGVITRSMSAWGLDDYIRVTIGKPDENKKFISVLKEIVGRKAAGVVSATT